MNCPSCGKDLAEGSISCPYCFKQFAPPARGGTALADGDFGVQFNRATTLWKENLGDLALFTLVFILVGWIPIVNAGFFAGYTRGLISLTRGGKPKTGDIFSSWDCFGNTLVYGLIFIAAIIVASFIPFIGPVVHFAVVIFGVPGFYPVIDRNMNAIEAIKWSISTVQRHFLPWLLAVLVGGVLASIGALALVVGIIFTYPWGALLVIQQYEVRKGDTAAESVKQESSYPEHG